MLARLRTGLNKPSRHRAALISMAKHAALARIVLPAMA
jgi:hypothetical protein